MSDSDTTDSSAAKDKAFLKSRKSLYNKRQYVKKCNITQGSGLVEQESKRLKSASSSGIIPIEANTSIGNIFFIKRRRIFYAYTLSHSELYALKAYCYIL